MKHENRQCEFAAYLANERGLAKSTCATYRHHLKASDRFLRDTDDPWPLNREKSPGCLMMETPGDFQPSLFFLVLLFIFPHFFFHVVVLGLLLVCENGLNLFLRFISGRFHLLF